VRAGWPDGALQVNVAGVALSAALVGAGYLMVAGHPGLSPYPRTVFTLYAGYAVLVLTGYPV